MKFIYICTHKAMRGNALKHTLKFVADYFPKHAIFTLTARTLAENPCNITNCDLFIMPGGASRDIEEDLTPTGIKAILNYIEKGGRYLGICGGACLFVSDTEFAKGHAQLERMQKRSRYIVKGKAIGPVYGGFSYGSFAGAHAAPLTCTKTEDFAAYIDGGTSL